MTLPAPVVGDLRLHVGEFGNSPYAFTVAADKWSSATHSGARRIEFGAECACVIAAGASGTLGERRRSVRHPPRGSSGHAPGDGEPN
jgi:hypothetical protein